MTLNQTGIDYICQNFGNTGLCCTDSGLSWYYLIGTTQYPETGGTAQIVSRLASGLIDSLVMTNPDRPGPYTQTLLNLANSGTTVTIQDAQLIHSGGHDVPGGANQWCYNAPPPVTGACCDILGNCTIKTQAECTAGQGTYMGDGTVCSSATCQGGQVTCWRCNGNTAEHSTPFPPQTICGQGAAIDYPFSSQPNCGGGIPVAYLILAAVAATAGIGVLYAMSKKKRK